jgi:hypothetical protein
MAFEKATITNTITNVSIPVLFNPEEYSVNRDNNFAQMAIPGLRSPLLQFVHGNMQTLEMELLVDSHETHDGYNQAGDDVRELTNQVVGLMDIDPSTHAPPVLIFTWGSFAFTCVLARANQRFIMFRPDGIPVRARLQVTFNEFTNAELEAKETKRETADYSRLYIVGEGESLSSIAAAVYQDATQWRPIAINNQIDDPRSLAVGTQLLIPHLPFQDPETGEVMV